MLPVIVCRSPVPSRKRLKEQNQLPDFSPAHLYLGLAYTQKGMFDQSGRELQTGERSDDRPLGIGALGYAYARAGRRNDAMRLLREMKQRSSRIVFLPMRLR